MTRKNTTSRTRTTVPGHGTILPPSPQRAPPERNHPRKHTISFFLLCVGRKAQRKMMIIEAVPIGRIFFLCLMEGNDKEAEQRGRTAGDGWRWSRQRGRTRDFIQGMNRDADVLRLVSSPRPVASFPFLAFCCTSFECMYCIVVW
jgi:hypothetical protein